MELIRLRTCLLVSFHKTLHNHCQALVRPKWAVDHHTFFDLWAEMNCTHELHPKEKRKLSIVCPSRLSEAWNAFDFSYLVWWILPVVTSSVYPVRSRIFLIFSSSGPFVFTVAVGVGIPCWLARLFCRYVFITPHKYADLFDTCSKFDSRNWLNTFKAPSTGNSRSASKARSSNSTWANFPVLYISSNLAAT